MNKYLFFIIIGIILFVLYNHIDSFSIGIPHWHIELSEAGKEAKGPPPQDFSYNDETDKWDAYLSAEEELYRLRNEHPEHYTNDIINLDDEGNEIAQEEAPCPVIPENVADRLCEPEPESCAASPLRNSLDGPGLRCGQPSVTSTGLGDGSRRTPCNRFLHTNAVRCYADNPEIMKSLFEEYQLLSALLSLPEDQVQDIVGFESLTSTIETQMLRSTFGPAFVPIFDFIRRNCQLFRFNDVLEILEGITFQKNNPFLEFPSGREITDLEVIKRRSRTIIYILLFLIKCNFNKDFIKLILNSVIYLFFIWNNNTYTYRDILVYNILSSLFAAFIHTRNNLIDNAINQWLSSYDDRFNDYIVDYGYNLWSISDNFEYQDYISLYQYLSNNCPEIMQSESGECPDIFSALMNPIFRHFFGLP
jgi:hypothetical protein